MRYLLLIYTNTKRWAELSLAERNQIHVECGAWHEELVKAGQSQGATALQSGATATTLGEQGGEIVITDGPFAETKEILGGFETIECKDLNEAIAIARRFPALRVGSLVEVRPLVVGMCQD